MDPKSRFSSRVENYIKYRPGYPPGLIETLQVECGLLPDAVVADIGSGTGLLTRMFLGFGCRVYGVEPNAEMRAAGDRFLAEYPGFCSAAGSAENTGLADACADFVTAGQAFHWFDPSLARVEFRRILRPGGWIVLVWNERRTDSTPFLREYEALLQAFATDYNQVNHRNVEENPDTIPGFIGGEYRVACLDNQQIFDYAGLEGRLLSSSYTPEQDSPAYRPMLEELSRIFQRYQQGNKVAIAYDTRIFYGQFSGHSSC